MLVLSLELWLDLCLRLGLGTRLVKDYRLYLRIGLCIFLDYGRIGAMHILWLELWLHLQLNLRLGFGLVLERKGYGYSQDYTKGKGKELMLG